MALPASILVRQSKVGAEMKISDIVLESEDASLEIKWRKQKAKDDQQKDSLDGTSAWSQNTYGGAEDILYGEAFIGTKLISRIMIGIHPDLGLMEIDKVWVDKSSRRKGIASKMINRAKKLTGINKIWAPHTTDDGDEFMTSYHHSDRSQ
jgi:GNAT superfamily N-acetyltransferase